MRIIPIVPTCSSEYSCTIYWVLGDYNRKEDRNTLIDAGSNSPRVFDLLCSTIANHSKGIGKSPVEQVILTHNHYDHSAGLPLVKVKFDPIVYAWEKEEGVDNALYDGQYLRAGDLVWQVLHTPGHSADSICLYCRTDKVLFSGDTLSRIMSPGGRYSKAFLRSLERLATLDIRVIYGGHDERIENGANAYIRELIKNVTNSVITEGE
jgi:glyoxylase-like metal-dependent hydrolase (beta-lactamase superfamily II)